MRPRAQHGTAHSALCVFIQQVNDVLPKSLAGFDSPDLQETDQGSFDIVYAEIHETPLRGLNWMSEHIADYVHRFIEAGYRVVILWLHLQ
jgi:hypothetical protein